jgi:transcriptional regulator with XRE-family HTH domain
MKAREELKAWLKATGRKQSEIAEDSGITPVQICRLLRGDGAVAPANLQALERVTGLSGIAARLAAEQPRKRAPKMPRQHDKPVRRPNLASVSEAPEPALPLAEAAPSIEFFDPSLPGLLAKAAGCPDSEPLFAAELKLAFTARSEGARQRAISDLLDRVNGRPTQKVIDLTPKPPAESPELVELFETLLKPLVEPAPEAEAAPEVIPVA